MAEALSGVNGAIYSLLQRIILTALRVNHEADLRPKRDNR